MIFYDFIDLLATFIIKFFLTVEQYLYQSFISLSIHMMKGIKIVLTNYPRLVMSQIVDGNLQLLNIEVYTEEIMKFLLPSLKKPSFEICRDHYRKPQ